MSLVETSLSRVTRDLGDMSPRPGSNIADELLRARDEAQKRIKKYTEISLDDQAASQTMKEIDYWSERNATSLNASLESSSQELPEQLKLKLGADRAKKFILATFVVAAAGLGPWSSGAVARYAAQGSAIKGVTVDVSWASRDAEQRLRVFKSITRLDDQGKLEGLLRPQQALSGLGAAWFLPALFVVIALVLLAAVVLTFVYFGRSLEANNNLIREMCLLAQKNKDKDTVEDCIDSINGLQGKDVAKWIAFTAVTGFGLYLLATHVAPMVIDSRRAKA